uniref:Uncharacterized protein n=1 Tax=Lepeophtheirus salmonis TaxID=72036 RepID=A0A0K2VLD3_LEPSM
MRTRPRDPTQATCRSCDTLASTDIFPS